MRLKILLIVLTASIGFTKTYCQNIDPFLAGAIIAANATENTNYNNIKDNQTAIQRAQEATIVVVDQVNQIPVSYTHLRAHETGRNLVCRLLLEKKNKTKKN